MKQGKFIVLEGVEGAGKTSQCKRLAAALEAKGIDAVLTREPGGVPLAERLRALILDTEYTPDALTELYMYMAARREHLNKIILPALAAGKTVICDRFTYSTVAYQGYGRGVDIEFIRALNAETVKAAKVDIALFLDVPPAVGFARKGGADCGDRMESGGIAFFERIYDGFKAMCAAGELVAIDATVGEQAVAESILKAVECVL